MRCTTQPISILSDTIRLSMSSGIAHLADRPAHSNAPSSPSSSAKRRPSSSTNGPDSKRTRSNMLASWSGGAKVALPVRSDLGHAPITGQCPQLGARRLVIKNLRNAPPKKVIDDYFARTWRELEEALEAFLANLHPIQPLDRLYRIVEDVCRNGAAARLSDHVFTRCEKYLNEDLAPRIRADGQAGDEFHMLRTVLRYWSVWNEQLKRIRSTFSYLDRTYLINTPDVRQINETGIIFFKKAVFSSRTTDGQKFSCGTKAIEGICDLVDQDRRGRNDFDSDLLKASISMLNVLSVYNRFEAPFLEKSQAYFLEFAEEQNVSCNLKQYIEACKRLLQTEDRRCLEFNLDSTTKRQLLKQAQGITIVMYTDKLLDNGDLGKLLDDNELVSMQALFELLSLSGLEQMLQEPWRNYILETATVIVSDEANEDQMAVRLLELRKKLGILVREAFANDERFTKEANDAFEKVINKPKKNSRWGIGTSKVGEMIAKHIDLLLRGGLKTLPASLISNSKDRAATADKGVADTADEEAELERQLDMSLDLFRRLDGKDVFEAFYKKDLARRLLLGRSASQDAERTMLSKLKNECGANYTHSLEQMFKDKQLAGDEMKAYGLWLKSQKQGGKISLWVDVLSVAAWPTYTEVPVGIPDEAAKELELFRAFYTNVHTGRKLTYNHNLSHCVVLARFHKGMKELLVSALQATILVLFNHLEEDGSQDKHESVLSYKQIADATGLENKDLKRTLQSLACGKVRVLTKHPKGRDVADTDTFTVNRGLSDPRHKIKINQIQHQETREENKATHERVAVDRQWEMQAAIVRIMKSRKELGHLQLVNEVIGQMKTRGMVEASQIKKEIEKLIDKDYLVREDDKYVYQA